MESFSLTFVTFKGSGFGLLPVLFDVCGKPRALLATENPCVFWIANLRIFCDGNERNATFTARYITVTYGTHNKSPIVPEFLLIGLRFPEFAQMLYR